MAQPGAFPAVRPAHPAVAAPNELDPMLVKAVVWRESRFDPQKFGAAGERGLMQVSEIAAREWAKENRIENFRPEELFDPKTNLEAGAWYLHRAMLHWQKRMNPVPFALAEYNAGASRAQRWAGGDGNAADRSAGFSAQHRFSRDEKIRGVDPRALPVLPRARTDVIRSGRVTRRRRKSCWRR